MIPCAIRDNEVMQPATTIPVESDYDVLVVGGGVAGFGAGVAAARAGCRTLIVEQQTMLGGLVTAGLVNIPLDFVSGIGADMFERLKAVDGLWHRNSDPEKHKLVLDRMVIESGCDVLLATSVVDAIVSGDDIRGVVVESKSGRHDRASGGWHQPGMQSRVPTRRRRLGRLSEL
jgi:ribulose 1,5-bisphosphate synthetase/thiazole synthase